MNNAPNLPQGLNVNTGVSVSLVVILVGGILWIQSSVGKTGAQVTTSSLEISNKISSSNDKIEALTKRMDRYETNKETWSWNDMFKWSVGLQRDNPTLKVPEPIARNSNTP